MSNKNKNKNGIVYSTDSGFNYTSEEVQATLSPSQQTLYVRREVRNGKPCVVIKEFVGASQDLKDLERKLKGHCGVGGSAKDGDIIIQGDLHAKVKAYLQTLGFKTKG